MLSNFRRRFALAGFTVERTAKGWQFCRSGHEREKAAGSRAYSSIASVTLMVARQLHKEVERRDAPHDLHQPLSRGAFLSGSCKEPVIAQCSLPPPTAFQTSIMRLAPRCSDGRTISQTTLRKIRCGSI